jgi:hypothetical protein
MSETNSNREELPDEPIVGEDLTPQAAPPAESVPEPPHSEAELEPHPHSPRRPNLDALMWALALIWVGATLIASNVGLLSRLSFVSWSPPWDLPVRPTAWALALLGLAALVSVDILVRLLVKSYRRNVIGYVILFIIFVSLGFGRPEIMWPLILLALGVRLLLRRKPSD